MDVLIVGSVATDTVETPFGKVENALGGSATFAAVAASYFAGPGIVAVVGTDFGEQHMNLLKRKKIDLEGLQVADGRTFHWAGYYEGDMNQAHTVSTELNVFENFKPSLPESYRDVPFVLLGNIHPALQLEVLEQLRRPRLVMCDTMNYWIESEPVLLEKVFRKVNVICINDGEARQYCGTDALPAAASELLELGPQRVILKKGVHGVLLFGRSSFFALPAMPLQEVKDPTGAGDSFAGGALGYIAAQRKLDETAFRRGLAAGTVMASFCVEDFSLKKTARLTKEMIHKRAELLREYTRMPVFRV